MKYPIGKASTARIRSYAKGLNKYNVEKQVLIPISPERFGQSPINKEKEGIFDDTYYLYLSGSPQRKSNALLRKLNDFYGYIKTLQYLYQHVKKGDIAVVYEGGVLWHALCALTIRYKKAKVIMELNELPYGTGKETYSAILHRKIMLNYIFPLYHGFFAISTSLMKLAEKYSPHSQTLKIPIIVESNKNIPKAHNTNGIYLFHSGSLSEQKDGILGMLKAFGIVSQKFPQPIKYYLTGRIQDSPHQKEIQQILQEYNIEDKVIFTGFLNEAELLDYQRNCYLTIINKYNTQQNIFCFSTKLGEYLACERAVITTDVGEATYYLQNDKNAYIIEPNNYMILADKILEALNNPVKNQQIGAEGFKLTQKDFNAEYQAKRIITFCQQLYNK